MLACSARSFFWQRLRKNSHLGRNVQLHRYVYEQLVGAIPSGLVLDHLCIQRNCCNPFHLEPVTIKENTLRGKAVLFRCN